MVEDLMGEVELDPKREDLKLQLVLNHRDEAPRRSASRLLSKLLFFP